MRVIVRVDVGAPARLALRTGEAEYTLAYDLTPGMHTLHRERDVEAHFGTTELRHSEVEDGGWLKPESARRLELIGDSSSAEFGALGTLGDDDFYASESQAGTGRASVRRRG